MVRPIPWTISTVPASTVASATGSPSTPTPTALNAGGLGLSFVTATDSTQLSPQAALLFNGAKQTVHGIEVAIVDRQKPLEMLAKRFGLLKEQVEVDFTDKLAQGLADILGRHDAAAPLRKEYSDD